MACASRWRAAVEHLCRSRRSVSGRGRLGLGGGSGRGRKRGGEQMGGHRPQNPRISRDIPQCWPICDETGVL